MKKIFLITTGLFLFLLLSKAQSITGTWTFNSGNFPITMLLLDNGTGEFQGIPIKYRTQEGKLYIDDGVQPIMYNFNLTQTTLTLTGGGLQFPISFTKPGSSYQNTSPVNQNITQSNTQYQNNVSSQTGNMSNMAGNTVAKAGGGSNLLGIWDGQQGKVIFYPEGTLLYNGTAYQYSSAGNSITITGTDGSTTFSYSLTNNELTMSQDANSAKYSKTSSLKPDRVDPQLVGKWCIMSTSTNIYAGGGSSSEECITLNADGSYVYFYSASRSVSAGGTATQNSDQGSWKTDGITLLSVSQTTGKTSRYSLSKENVQNGDAAIVIGGRKFVTAYNRPRW